MAGIVRRHKDLIAVTSGNVIGTRFTVFLPTLKASLRPVPNTDPYSPEQLAR